MTRNENYRILTFWPERFLPGKNILQHRSSLKFDMRFGKLTCGTNEELALVNAVKTAFPGTNHILCERNLIWKKILL